MADIAKTIFDTGLTCWDRTATYRKYIRHLGDNLTALKIKTEELGHVYDDVTAEGEGWIRKSGAAGWLERVKTLKEEVDKNLTEGKQTMGKNCLCGLCFSNCRARYAQSELAEGKKAELETELHQASNFKVKDDVAYEPPDLILRRSLEALRQKRDELQGVFETVKQRVKWEEDRHLVRTPEVRGWLDRVKLVLEKEVREILKQGAVEMAKSCKGEGEDSQSQRNSTSISIRAEAKRAILEEQLIAGRGFTVFSCRPDDYLMVARTLEPPVGGNAMFEEVWNWVEDETISCIGIFGMGGVGKTVLLDRVYNQFLHPSHDYDFVLRVVASRPANLDEIQNTIWKKLKLPEDEWNFHNRQGRADIIQSLMREKNFLLFLDNLWDHIELLTDLGIPRDHPKKCKIIFNTRDEGVCSSMKPNRTKKMECLPQDEALQLFRQKLGEKTWRTHPKIPEIAATMICQCKYLPLAVVTMARIMTGAMELKRWVEAEESLKIRLSKFPDMEKEVLTKLEYSYDSLPDETHKRCFLYMSMFPEDQDICEDDAIELWIGEGFLDGCVDVHEARAEGARILRSLRHACLVKYVKRARQFGAFIKMHDVVREMALWIESKQGSMKNRTFVQGGEFYKWKDADRILLCGGDQSFHSSLATVSCSSLSTLILRGTNWTEIPDEFFLCMPSLKVLNLSRNSLLENLPKSLWKLINLRYLKIDAFRRLIVVPEEIKNLKKLVVLILPRTVVLPEETISNLSSLRVFHWSNLSLPQRLDGYSEMVLLEDRRMQAVEEICLTLGSPEGIDKFLSCPEELHGHSRGLSLYQCFGLPTLRISASSVRRLGRNLQFLNLFNCRIGQIHISGDDEGSQGSHAGYPYSESDAPKPSRFASRDGFYSLRDVTISGCGELQDVTSLIYHAPNLESLRISHCQSMSEVIACDIEETDTTNNSIFQCLTFLQLSFLYRLESICMRALPFPSLKQIEVFGCPNLKKLPLDCNSANNTLQTIEGEEEWWEDLEWDDPACEGVFSSKFVRKEDE
ncbi:probable disease resistance protein At5g63020 [Punica granatum]|uniref:Probable disease resistance protein At5g63020 n=1 Tax=Punica granatum TaxID=22663 RepID=A0A218XEL7_PUNGR|nr:probable disease resistance protein At5g63020 [Punica granatum]OWM82921.1 hypothetical protein CDL15_Pgr005321 [Punica granatum]